MENIGPYELIEELGRGGTSTVYRAYQANIDRFVAVKVLHMSFLDDSSILQRFTREARVVAKLEHPHILPLYDFDGNHEPPYLVMRYMPTGTLKDRILTNPTPLNFRQIVELFRQIGAALDYSHRQGVVHRDMKPSNIMLDGDGNALVADFGIARYVEQKSENNEITSFGMTVGTPGYMSPEQILTGEVDGRTDVYSLGVILYELLTGNRPYGGDSATAVKMKHLNAPIPSLQTASASMPPSLDAVMQRALAKEKDQRYALVTDFIRELTEAATQLNYQLAGFDQQTGPNRDVTMVDFEIRPPTSSTPAYTPRSRPPAPPSADLPWNPEPPADPFGAENFNHDSNLNTVALQRPTASYDLNAPPITPDQTPAPFLGNLHPDSADDRITSSDPRMSAFQSPMMVITGDMLKGDMKFQEISGEASFDRGLYAPDAISAPTTTTQTPTAGRGGRRYGLLGLLLLLLIGGGIGAFLMIGGGDSDGGGGGSNTGASTDGTEIVAVIETETPEPTAEPTADVTPEPTEEVTPIPTAEATEAPMEMTAEPTEEATETPEPLPTEEATEEVTPEPIPTEEPMATEVVATEMPAADTPTSRPTNTPRPVQPTFTPTLTPTIPPTETDTPQRPTNTPERATNTPIPTDTLRPTNTPTRRPTNTPTRTPTATYTPSRTPTFTPSPTATPLFNSPAAVVVQFGNLGTASAFDCTGFNEAFTFLQERLASGDPQYEFIRPFMDNPSNDMILRVHNDYCEGETGDIQLPSSVFSLYRTEIRNLENAIP